MFKALDSIPSTAETNKQTNNRIMIFFTVGQGAAVVDLSFI